MPRCPGGLNVVSYHGMDDLLVSRSRERRLMVPRLQDEDDVIAVGAFRLGGHI